MIQRKKNKTDQQQNLNHTTNNPTKPNPTNSKELKHEPNKEVKQKPLHTHIRKKTQENIQPQSFSLSNSARSGQ